MTTDAIGGTPSEPDLNTQSLKTTVDVLTALYDTYARRALQQLCQGGSWHTWQVLAEEVEFRIAHLAPATYPGWAQVAAERELAWYAEHCHGGSCTACGD